eukprot:SAG31_NODE_3604_length_4078_cov_1.491832_4_plen_189_part_00
MMITLCFVSFVMCSILRITSLRNFEHLRRRPNRTNRSMLSTLRKQCAIAARPQHFKHLDGASMGSRESTCGLVICQISRSILFYLFESMTSGTIIFVHLLRFMCAGVPWLGCSNSYFLIMWCCYARSFDRLISEWSEDVFANVQPAGALPFGGLLQSIGWSRARGEEKQVLQRLSVFGSHFTISNMMI